MNSNQKRRVVILGCCGFIGTQLFTVIQNAGFDVWGIDRVVSDNPQIIQANLLDPQETKTAFQRIGKCDVILHLMALSTGTQPPLGETLETVNIKFTQNILNAVNDVEQFIYFSTTTVYGEENRNGFVSPRDELRPASLYGIGKKQCEEMIIAKNFRATAICRPTPVYSENRMRNLQVRAYFPFTKIKIRLIPSPRYSLCNIQKVLENTLQVIQENKPGISIRNFADEQPFFQSEIVKMFSGYSWPFFTYTFFPFYLLLKLIPGKKSYKLRCLYRKLFASCLYSTEVVEIQKPQINQ
jgi:Nucleoside-diphosphate-sugar epimerases